MTIFGDFLSLGTICYPKVPPNALSSINPAGNFFRFFSQNTNEDYVFRINGILIVARNDILDTQDNFQPSGVNNG